MKISFKYKFIYSFVTIELAFLTMIILLNFHTLHNTEHKLLYEKIDASTMLFGELIKTPLMIYDLATIDNEVKMFSSLKNVDTIIVQDKNDRVLSTFTKGHTDNIQTLLNNNIALDKKIKINGQIYIAKEFLLVEEGIHIGNMKILFNITESKEVIIFNTKVTFLIALFEIIVSLFVSFLIGYKLTDALSRLTLVTKQITENEDRIVNINIKSGDEVETLSNSIQLMHEKIFVRNKKIAETTQELKELNANLEKRISEEVQRNKEKDVLMMSKFRWVAMGEMLVNISHYWRQPIAAISAIAQDIIDAHKYNELDSAYLRHSVDNVVMITKDMSTMIDFFKDSYKFSDEVEDFNLSTTIRNCIKLIDASLKSENIVLHADIHEEVIVRGIPGEFSQALLNILINSKEAIVLNKIPSGIINISLDKLAYNCKSVLIITDNGGGILEEYIDKIFDPYFSTKNKTAGTGLGLYNTKVTIENIMHGSIAVYNIEGGVAFRIEV
ncbi:MAG: HAMP domain-containing histidine kinase [Candidatus Magnetoovum sp. WYHC-5]|nr:HAMP domain-containing histidine kinase [Candidatus Magnetoovum sp. WYHC-5]